MKRIFLFIMTNLAVLALLSIVVFIIEQLFHVRLGQGGLGALLVMASVFGFGGAFISLLLSKWIAKRTMGVEVITQPRSDLEQWLLATVARLASGAGVAMPEVGIFDAPEMNAFATGARRNAALVAVSTGLLRGMSRNQIEAVLGHEMTHVANGDMVTLALIQGVVNAFVLYLSHIVATIVRSALAPRDSQSREPNFLSVLVGQAVFMVCQVVFSLLGSMVVAWFSRRREFRADQGGASLAGRGNMVAALRHLMSTTDRVDTRQAALQSFKIAGGRSLLQLFATHPPLPERIAALERS